MRERLSYSLLCLALLLSVPAAAEIVVFSSGGFLKVEGFELRGEKVRLDLPSGGRMTVKMARVARILEDEIAEVPPDLEPEPPPAFSLRFDSKQAIPTTPYGELIYETAKRHALNPELLAAMVRAESAFQAEVISHKGAQGLMQLMPATAERFGLRGRQVFEPAKNLEAGARYLSWLADRFDDDLPRVLAAYNSGEGTVDRFNGVPPYRETRTYIRRIYSFLGLPAEEV